MSSILVTGGAGFIGSHAIKVCVDNFNDYYDPQLKEDRIKVFLKDYKFPLYRIDICDYDQLAKVFSDHKIDKICHIAARAGVRASIEHPILYEESNIKGTLHLLELARQHNIKGFIFASSSSVYGNNQKIPFSEDDDVNNPISPYAATKRACELMISTYHQLYNIKSIMLRFFTVIGPWGRPDLAYYKFANLMVKDQPIDIYNHGNLERDFTYIDDIIAGVLAAIESDLELEIINLGNNKPVKLDYFVECLEKELGLQAKKNPIGMQPGDVFRTYADISKAQKLLGFQPKTNIEDSIKHFINWYKDYHKI